MKIIRMILVLAAIAAGLVLSSASALAADFTVTANGTSAYVINGVNNPTLTLQRGTTYTFAVNAIGHPFDIKTNNSTGTANRYNNGVTGQGVTSGTLTFAVPLDAPTPLHYNCELHAAMTGIINLVNPANTPPSVTITNPTTGTVFASPASVTIQANASDTDGTVTNVQFRVNSTVLLNDPTAPFSATTNNMPSGSYTLTAIASDNLGATATNSVSITVDAAPTISITNPIAGSIFTPPANVTIQAGASDNGSVSGVLFLVDANTLTNDIAAPYSGVTNNLSPGSHTLTAIATDNLGLKATNAISIIVDSPPSVTITNPVNGAVFTAPANVTIQASAADTDGTVTNVQFLVGSTVLTNDNAAPFAAVTNNLAAGSYTLSAIAADNNGVKTTNSVNIIVNALPSISITNPAAGAKFRAPTNLVLKASASDTDGTITNVQFFSGATSLGNVTTAPFNFTNNNLPAGNYTFTAKALDNLGDATTSAAVNVFLLTNATLASPVRLTNGQLVFTLSGIAGQTYTTEASTNLFTWIPILTNVVPASLFNVTNADATNFPLRFYRTRQDF